MRYRTNAPLASRSLASRPSTRSPWTGRRWVGRRLTAALSSLASRRRCQPDLTPAVANWPPNGQADLRQSPSRRQQRGQFGPQSAMPTAERPTHDQPTARHALMTAERSTRTDALMTSKRSAHAQALMTSERSAHSRSLSTVERSTRDGCSLAVGDQVNHGLLTLERSVRAARVDRRVVSSSPPCVLAVEWSPRHCSVSSVEWSARLRRLVGH